MGWNVPAGVGRAELPTKKGYVSMKKLLNKVSSVLNITFKGDYASRAGVSFRRGTNSSVMVGSTVYNNVYGIITDKLSDVDMKGIANNIANIANIGKLISVEMKKVQVKPHGRWFVTSHTVRTQVEYNYKMYNAVYSTDTGKQIGKLKLLSESEIKPASTPSLRFKNKTKEEQATASPQFDRIRFNKYVVLVADFRNYYKVNAEKLLSMEISEAAQKQLDLNKPEQVLHAIIDQVRRWNGKEYKATIESEVESIIKKVEEMRKK